MTTSVPHTVCQPPSVDFIDNRMADIHDLFKAPTAHYDPVLKKYTLKLRSGSRIEDLSCADEKAAPVLSPRPVHQTGDVMIFWDSLFTDAMEIFKQEHKVVKGRDKSEYNIRSKANWTDVYAELQRARERFDDTKKGFWGRAKRLNRQVAEHSHPASQIMKLVPEIDYVSPVRAVVEVCLEAIRNASSVRKMVTSSLNGQQLEKVFGDIEHFFRLYSGDEKISEASIALIVAVFKAVEDTITFFLTKQGDRVVKALTHGDQYQKDLLSSIQRVQDSSDELWKEAHKSFMLKTDNVMTTIQTTSQQWQNENSAELLRIHKRLDDGEAGIMNILKDILDEAKKNKEINLENQRMILQGLLSLENEASMLSRPQTPMGWVSPMISWPESHPQGTMQYMPQQAIHWTNSLPSIQTLQGLNLESGAPILESLLNGSALLQTGNDPEFDINQVLEGVELITLKYHGTADQIACTQQFQDWILDPLSAELLVHGDYSLFGGSHHISPLSLFCTTLDQAFLAKDSYLPLMFNCGQHTEPECGAGGTVMIMSLMSQLLKQHDYTSLPLQIQFDHESVRHGDVRYLCSLFEALVHLLSAEYTVVCIIDGISYYETDEFAGDTITILDCILGLVHHQGLRAAVKLLVCSPGPTDRVQNEFGGVNANVLDMAGTRLLSQEAGSMILNNDFLQV